MPRKPKPMLSDAPALWEASRAAHTHDPAPEAYSPSASATAPPRAATTGRPLTLPQAQACYQQRYTMDHVPFWATHPVRRDGVGNPESWPGPQFASDAEWYERTVFPGEHGLPRAASWCISGNCSWPLGSQLPAPYAVQHPNPGETGRLDKEASHVV